MAKLEDERCGAIVTEDSLVRTSKYKHLERVASLSVCS